MCPVRCYRAGLSVDTCCLSLARFNRIAASYAVDKITTAVVALIYLPAFTTVTLYRHQMAVKIIINFWCSSKKYDFKLLQCCECCIISFGWFPGFWILCADVSEHTVSVPSSWVTETSEQNSGAGASPKRKNTTKHTMTLFTEYGGLFTRQTNFCWGTRPYIEWCSRKEKSGVACLLAGVWQLKGMGGSTYKGRCPLCSGENDVKHTSLDRLETRYCIIKYLNAWWLNMNKDVACRKN
jgi:hypothetical protein